MEPEDLIPFLTRNLHWRILNSFGTERQREEVGGLKVLVMERLVSLPLLECDVPVFEEYTVQADITHGRPGGLKRGEEVQGGIVIYYSDRWIQRRWVLGSGCYGCRTLL
ncbi:hypothetical protein MMC15_001373 [Xylographa vitiligo]|nr:hypothetical protein [Xylographa vitiligo]